MYIDNAGVYRYVYLYMHTYMCRYACVCVHDCEGQTVILGIILQELSALFFFETGLSLGPESLPT